MSEMLNNPFALTKSEIAIFGLGRDYEQERIIKLLEGLMDFETDTQRRIEHFVALQFLKDALIKGEK